MNTHPATVDDLNGLEAHLLSRIKGQNHVIPRVCSVLERGQLGLQPAGKPLGSFLFLGPTGVGKTELTLEFTRYLFGGELPRGVWAGVDFADFRRSLLASSISLPAPRCWKT